MTMMRDALLEANHCTGRNRYEIRTLCLRVVRSVTWESQSELTPFSIGCTSSFNPNYPVQDDDDDETKHLPSRVGYYHHNCNYKNMWSLLVNQTV